MPGEDVQSCAHELHRTTWQLEQATTALLAAIAEKRSYEVEVERAMRWCEEVQVVIATLQKALRDMPTQPAWRRDG